MQVIPDKCDKRNYLNEYKYAIIKGKSKTMPDSVLMKGAKYDQNHPRRCP